jgi:transposase
MIQITPQMRVLLAVEPVDFRKGIDGLARVCREELAADPFSGFLFVFRNRKSTAVRILVYDGYGFWLMYRRLSRGRFRWWPEGEKIASLEAHELQLLLYNGNPELAQTDPPWRRVAMGGGGKNFG